MATIAVNAFAACGSSSAPTTSRPSPTTASQLLHATYVTLPAKNASPTGVALDSQGTLWTTEEGGDAIARVSASGQVSEITLPRPGAPGLGIVRAPDGSMWFTDRDANEVDRIATNGSLLRVPLRPGSTPLGICTGPLNSLWVTENGNGVVDRISNNGTVTKAADLGVGAAPVGIVDGPDGNLWVAESNGIARVTLTGVVAQYALAAGVGALRIIEERATTSGLSRSREAGPDASTRAGTSRSSKPHSTSQPVSRSTPAARSGSRSRELGPSITCLLGATLCATKLTKLLRNRRTWLRRRTAPCGSPSSASERSADSWLPPRPDEPRAGGVAGSRVAERRHIASRRPGSHGQLGHGVARSRF